jgi:hypothetical protein
MPPPGMRPGRFLAGSHGLRQRASLSKLSQLQVFASPPGGSRTFGLPAPAVAGWLA